MASRGQQVARARARARPGAWGGARLTRPSVRPGRQPSGSGRGGRPCGGLGYRHQASAVPEERSECNRRRGSALSAATIPPPSRPSLDAGSSRSTSPSNTQTPRAGSAKPSRWKSAPCGATWTPGSMSSRSRAASASSSQLSLAPGSKEIWATGPRASDPRRPARSPTPTWTPSPDRSAVQACGQLGQAFAKVSERRRKFEHEARRLRSRRSRCPPSPPSRSWG